EGCLVIDAGKAPGRVAMTQDEINACLVEHGLAGRFTVRLKGGDPFVFGRGSEEAEALHAAGVPYEVVPGVSSAIAAPSAAGVPVTHRGLATHVTIVTGHEDPAKPETQTDWASLARAGGTLVLLMGVGRLAGIADALIAGGRDPGTPVAIVERAPSPTQRVTTGELATIAATAAAAGVSSPAVTVVGDVVAVRAAIGWAERLPLAGRVVAVTRPRAQADGLSRRLADLGARVVQAPLIRTEPVPGGPIDPSACDILVVTSPNAPALLLERIGGDARSETRSATMPTSRSAAAVAGPIAATSTPCSAGTPIATKLPIASTTPASTDERPSDSRRSGTDRAADVAAARFQAMLSHV
ncbi:MAG: uroporphyrinogen-III C-methyltransferase, partial [Actinomycetota bacterium]